MKTHEIRVHTEAQPLRREDQLTWKLAEVATEKVKIDADVTEMVIDRLIDYAAVSIAAISRPAVVAARGMALSHRITGGATIFGVQTKQKVSAENAAWANGAAACELDHHDVFCGAECINPADTIAPILAAAQRLERSGNDLIRGIVVGYEAVIALARGIAVSAYGMSPIAHLCPAQVAGVGMAAGIERETLFRAIHHAVHGSFRTQDPYRGGGGSWTSFGPAASARLAIDVIDRAVRGERVLNPIYEGKNGVIATNLGGPDAVYHVELPEKLERRRAIMESYPREHAAAIELQALIDLALRLQKQIENLDAISTIIIHTSEHTHRLFGDGANDPSKRDPYAVPEALVHSLPYVVAIVLQDGVWRHYKSCSPQRAGSQDTITLWRKIETRSDPKWTERFANPDPAGKALGGRIEITFADGSSLIDEIEVADLHPRGTRSFTRQDYIRKFEMLTDDFILRRESERFLAAVQRLPKLTFGELDNLNILARPTKVPVGAPGIFAGSE